MARAVTSESDNGVDALRRVLQGTAPGILVNTRSRAEPEYGMPVYGMTEDGMTELLCCKIFLFRDYKISEIKSAKAAITRILTPSKPANHKKKISIPLRTLAVFSSMRIIYRVVSEMSIANG